MSKVSNEINHHPGYDIIGDVHGELGNLEALLDRLGYRETPRGRVHPGGRKALFVGDFIDRGTNSRGVLHLVRSMVDEGSAEAVMGNHEYNFVTYLTPDGEGGFLRPHTKTNSKAVKETLVSFTGHEHEIAEFIEWMRGLPFFLERDGLRIVHASWIEEDIEFLRDKTMLDDAFLFETTEKDSRAHEAVENVLKGVEIDLPDEVSFVTHDGVERFCMRVRWWEELNGRPWREIGYPERAEYPRTIASFDKGNDLAPYSESAPIVLFGHYKLIGETPRIEAPNVATLDYGSGHGGPATAYRWNGERALHPGNFVSALEVELINKAPAAG